MFESRRKYAGKEFLARLRGMQVRTGTSTPEINDFAALPLDMRVDVALSLIAIASDRSERFMNRKLPLQILAMIIGLSGLQRHEQIEAELTDILANLELEYSQEEFGIERANVLGIQKSALVALLAVNPETGTERLNYLIRRHGSSEFGAELRELL